MPTPDLVAEKMCRDGTMKRFTLLISTLVLSVWCSLSALAYDVLVDGIYYNLISKDKTAEVTFGDNQYYGEVIIPSSISVNGVNYSVNSIGDLAFQFSTELKSVTVPNSVISIGWGAFYCCSELTSINIPNSITSIGDNVFHGCNGINYTIIVNDMFVYLPRTYSGHYSIPENISIIIGGAFNNCSGLTSITIPNSVTRIGDSAFESAWRLKSITIPNSVTEIGTYVFAGCSGLTSVTIPNSVTSIGDGAFANCMDLTTVNIPNTITCIGEMMFSNCQSLKSFIIPNSVTNIEKAAFDYCTNLTSITIPNSVTSIGEWAFGDCDNMKNVYCHAEKIPSTHISAFESTDIKKSTLHVTGSALSSYKSTEPWSGFGTIKALDDEPTNINTAKTRGIVIQSAGGFITLSGLDTNERVDFFAIDGAALGSATATDGTATFSATSGTIVVAKIGKESVKIAVE